jgi:two-component system, cell cycle response regulator
LIHKVCIHGFSAFECSTFESFFRLAANRVPSYQCVTDIGQADVVIADADRTESIEFVTGAGKLSRTLAIGAVAVPGSAAGASRPINMMALLRMLDELTRADTVQPRKEVLPTPAPAASLPSAAAPAPGAGTAGYRSPAPAATATALMTAPMREADGFAGAVGDDADASHILVVDDSDIALRFMQIRLHRLRFRVSLASSGDQALKMLETRRYAFVFLDVMMAGIDGFETCKRIKRKTYPDGAAPHVIMLTSKGGPIDKLRGTIARCDGYLVKPLNELELVKVISEFDPGFMRRIDSSIAA